MSVRCRAASRTLLGVAALLALVIDVASGATPRLVFEAVVRGEVEEQALRWPIAIASAAPDEIVVAEVARPRLVVFHRDEEGEWRVERSIPVEGTPAAVAGAGEQYLVATRGPSALFLLHRDDWTLRRIALSRDSRPGALAGLRDGGFLVHDPGTGQIVSLDASGATSGRIPAPAPMIALAASPDGGFYAADAIGGRVTQHRPDGTERAAWSLSNDGPRPPFPGALALSDNGDPIVLDRHTARLVRLAPGGRVESLGGGRGREPGRLFYPRGIAALGGDRFAIADLGNGRVQIVRLEERE